MKIIRPFRWWKTFGISCAVVSPVALLAAASKVSTAGDPAFRLGELLGAFTAVVATFGAALALVLCIAQIWALNAYYWSGTQKTVYYVSLCALTLVVPLLTGVVFGALGVAGVTWYVGWSLVLFLALASYFVGRRMIAADIAKMDGSYPAQSLVLPHHSSPSLLSAKVKYTWPAVAIAAAVVIVAALIYAASFKRLHAQSAVTTGSVLAVADQPSTMEQLLKDPDIAKGLRALVAKDGSTAVAAFAKASDNYPRSDAVFFYLGRAYWAQGDSNKARESYERAIQLNPQNADAWIYLGLHLNLTEPTKAIDDCKKMTELRPNNAFAWYILGMTYSVQNQSSLAVPALERAAQIKPDLAAAWSLLAKTYSLLGDRERSSHAQARFEELESRKGASHGLESQPLPTPIP